MKASQLIAIIIAIVALLWIGSGFIAPPAPQNGQGQTQDSAASGEKEAEKALMQVRVRDMRAQLYPDIVQVTGRTQASRNVKLRAEITGQIQSLLKEEGDVVDKGDILAELEVLDRQARVTEARERVNQRQIEYNAAKKLANKGFNSKVRLAQALADLENAKAALKQSQVDLGKIRIAAPFEGIIADQNVEAGDYLSVGDSLFSVVDLDPIEFVGFVSEKRIQDLQTGLAAKAEFLNGDTLQGKISYIAPAADADTRTFRLIIAADNADRKIKEGLTAKIKIPVAKKQAYKISPSVLTLDDDGRVGVKIVNADNIVEFVPIEILNDTAQAMWITGLPATARIITVGQEFVASGQQVDPQIPPPDSQTEGLL